MIAAIGLGFVGVIIVVAVVVALAIWLLNRA
jgi:hypothetical protein